VFLPAVPVTTLLPGWGRGCCPRSATLPPAPLDLVSALLCLVAVLAVVFGLKQAAQDGLGCWPARPSWRAGGGVISMVIGSRPSIIPLRSLGWRTHAAPSTWTAPTWQVGSSTAAPAGLGAKSAERRTGDPRRVVHGFGGVEVSDESPVLACWTDNGSVHRRRSPPWKRPPFLSWRRSSECHYLPSRRWDSSSGAPDFDLVLSAFELTLLGQRRSRTAYAFAARPH
jgi:hypothetical protein